MVTCRVWQAKFRDIRNLDPWTGMNRATDSPIYTLHLQGQLEEWKGSI